MTVDRIKVCCRFRVDKENEEVDDWLFDQENKIVSLREKKFNFDEILDMNTNQEESYLKVAAKTIQEYVKGYHGTIFAYGNSGSGKTYSIVGPDNSIDYLIKDFSSVPPDIQKLYGIIPRATIDIFSAVNEFISQGATVKLTVSYIEIYNESIICLLNGKENLKIHEVPKVGFAITGKEERPVKCPEDIFKVIYIGSKNKTIAGTAQNERSSRSHTLLTLELKVSTLDGSERCSKLNIVDLAGSEKLRNTGITTPERLKEAQKINQSLSTLGMCIMALSENAKFIPFRNSKLTLLLKESLGGNSKTTLLCTARRDKKLAEDNLNALNFSQRAKCIKTKSVKNVKLSDKECEYLISALKNEIVILRKQIKELGKDYKPFTDPRLLSLLGEEADELNLDSNMEDSTQINIENTDNKINTNNNSNNNETTKSNIKVKRQSLINLTEEEIIFKYCELKAKYDNLVESASSKILQLTQKLENSDPESISAQNIQFESIKKQHEIQIINMTKELSDVTLNLNQVISKLEKEKKLLNEELTTQKDECSGLQEMLNLNTQDIEGLNSSLSEKEEENKRLLNRIKELEISNSSKDKEIETLNNYIKSLNTSNDNDKLKSLEIEKNYQNKVCNLEKTINNKDLSIEELNAKINNNSNEYDKNLKQKELQITNLNKDKHIMTENIQNLELDNKNLNSRILVLEERIESLKQQSTELQALNINLSDKVSQLSLSIENSRNVDSKSSKNEKITNKVEIKKNIFGVNLLKSTNNKFLKEAIEESNKANIMSEILMKDKIEELKKLRENIHTMTPKTVSSHNSDLDGIISVDFDDLDAYRKAQMILEKKQKEREERKILKEMNKET